MNNEDNIRVIVENGRKNNVSAYESLKEKDIIKSYENDFMKLSDAI
ncbi:hypothetical protein [Caloranaerobacter azorensis]|nr:hypothetical protein [Caloranaerobacter azorensis]